MNAVGAAFFTEPGDAERIVIGSILNDMAVFVAVLPVTSLNVTVESNGLPSLSVIVFRSESEQAVFDGNTWPVCEPKLRTTAGPRPSRSSPAGMTWSPDG